MNRFNIYSDTDWEKRFSYCRCVRVGNSIEVSGTVSVEGGKVIHMNDMFNQCMFILQKIEKALLQAGGERKHIIRTRMFVCNMALSEEAGKAHGEFFLGIDPVTTMVEVKSLIHPDLLIEIEASAIVCD